MALLTLRALLALDPAHPADPAPLSQACSCIRSLDPAHPATSWHAVQPAPETQARFTCGPPSSRPDKPSQPMAEPGRSRRPLRPVTADACVDQPTASCPAIPAHRAVAGPYALRTHGPCSPARPVGPVAPQSQLLRCSQASVTPSSSHLPLSRRCRCHSGPSARPGAPAGRGAIGAR